MTLNDFRSQEIKWDKANKQMFTAFKASSGDSNGRKLSVQVLDEGKIVDLTGVVLSLAWQTKNKENYGLDAFRPVDATKGIFEIFYTTEMLSNTGTLRASLVLVDGTGRVESDSFSIMVKDSVVNDSSVQSENSFTALTEALIQISKYQSDIDGIKQDLVDESNQLITTEKAELDALQLDYAERAEALEETYAPRLTEVTAQLAETGDTLTKTHLINKVYGVLKPFAKPTTFPIAVPFAILTAKNGEVTYQYDVAVQKNPVSKRYYVDVVNGSNNNAGSEDAPFKTLERAFRYGDSDEIVLKAGIYDWTTGTAGTVPISTQKKRFNLIGVGDVYIGAHRGGQTWSLVDGYSNVYHTSVSSVVEVVDIRNYDNPVFYSKKTSIAGVGESNGSYFVNGLNVYARTVDGTPPDNKILLNMVNNALELNDFERVYMENIKFTNTVTINNPTLPASMFFKNCDFMFGTGDNSLSIWGGVSSLAQNCRAMYGERDGFNYHFKNGKLPQAIEIDCIGAFNGRDGGNSNNGSTMHDGGTVLRVRGEYYRNHGPNVIDVNPGTKSLNIGVQAHSSIATAAGSNVNFRTRDAEMWLVNCISHDSTYATSKEGSGGLVVDNSLLVGEEVVI